MAEPDPSAVALSVPAPEVVAELRRSAVPREGRAALAAGAAGELGTWTRSWSPFLCLYGFAEWQGSLEQFPDWAGAAGPDGRPTHAFGPWQNQPLTYRQIAAMTGRPGVRPQDLIANNWVLAVRDFASRKGGDLLAALQGGQLATVQTGLAGTWPGGFDSAFPARYRAALALFAEMPPPIPQHPAFTLRLGSEVSFPLAGTDQDGQPFTPPDALQSDDLAVCTVYAADGSATIVSVGLGRTSVHGADLAIDVTIEGSRLVHLAADLSKAVVSRIPKAAAAAALVALALLPRPAEDPPMSIFAPAIEAPKPIDRTPPMDREPSVIGRPDFCLASGSPLAIERCLVWTAALSRR